MGFGKVFMRPTGCEQEATVEAEQVDVGPRFARAVPRVGGGGALRLSSPSYPYRLVARS